MTQDRLLRRKWTLRAHGRQVIFIKHAQERTEHVLMKAFIWALYLPDYPDLSVEIRIGDRYKPDVVMLDAHGRPLFWGEAGQVSPQKIERLARRNPDTHFAIAKWDLRLDPLLALVTETLDGLTRRAPFDLISLPPDAAERFIDDRGNVSLTLADLAALRDPVRWVRLGSFEQV